MKTIYIGYYGGITENSVRSFMAACADIISKYHPECLYFLFASPGGSVDSGIALYNFLRALPCKIIFHNMGAIDSIATVVFLAGEERFAAPHSSFLLHGITYPPASSLNRAGIEELFSHLKESENKLANITVERTKLSNEEIRCLFRQGETKDLSFALEKGVIHQIIQPAIPSNEQFISFNFPP